jgi:hypothetical protein
MRAGSYYGTFSYNNASGCYVVWFKPGWVIGIGPGSTVTQVSITPPF